MKHIVGTMAVVAVFATGIGLWVFASRIAMWSTAPPDAPINRPFPIERGERVVVSFVPKLTETYFIGIAFERNPPMSRLQEIIGPTGGKPTARPKISVALDAGGEPVAVQPSRGTWWGAFVGFDLGSFQAHRGVTYTLTAEVKDAQPDLRTLHGHLLVQVDGRVTERFGACILRVRIAAIGVAIFGVLLALGVFLPREHPIRPNQALQPTASRRTT